MSSFFCINNRNIRKYVQIGFFSEQTRTLLPMRPDCIVRKCCLSFDVVFSAVLWLLLILALDLHLFFLLMCFLLIDVAVSVLVCSLLPVLAFVAFS